ncbi:MAG: hypothetical protein D6760_07745 [Deltaproteobacteria bacterium]|nr:MAG: hypothetical protein D6760_07745 [Deltaproteobacteria bacterium]
MKTLPDGWTVLPGPQPTSGFLGDDSGWIGPVIGENAEALPWPYAEAAGVIGDWALRLPRGRSSPWLEIRVGDRSGVFRVYRADDVRAYLTPVYVRSWPAAAWNTSAPERLYVAEEPGWAGPSGEGGDEWVLRHLLDLVRERAQAVAAAAAGSRLIVYGEDFLARVDCGTGCPRDQDGQLVATAEVRRAYRTLEEVLESFRAALPGPAVTVLLGAGGGPDWFRQVSSADRPLGVAVVATRRPTGPATVTASLDDVRATLLDLLDVRAEPGCGRVFTRLEAAGSGTFGPACGSERGETWQPLDVHELVEAGQAPGAD